MKRRFLTSIVLLALCLTTLIVVIASRAQVVEAESSDSGLQRPVPLVAPPTVDLLASTACAVQPDKGSEKARRQAMLDRRARLLASRSTLITRFRQAPVVAAAQTGEGSASDSGTTNTGYVPREEIALIDPTNYGDRYLFDINGQPADLEPLVVLHETVGSASSAISLFQTFHLNDDDQASYHTLIKRDGTLVYLVPPDKRAFGAGNSVFVGANGPEAVKTNPSFPPSVNNFAYHISLESPYDGNSNGYTHSGYTQAQYQSLAWLVAKTGVADERITTHKAVDRSHTRIDPRSFSDARFFSLLRPYSRTPEIAIRCTNPADLTTTPSQ